MLKLAKELVEVQLEEPRKLERQCEAKKRLEDALQKLVSVIDSLQQRKLSTVSQ